MALSEEDVVRALDSLRLKLLVVLAADGGRVPKYRHLLAEKMGLIPVEQAIICELLVRGPQTLGELRTREERMYPIGDLAAVEEVLQELMQREKPLIALLPRQPGRKDRRSTKSSCFKANDCILQRKPIGVREIGRLFPQFVSPQIHTDEEENIVSRPN